MASIAEIKSTLHHFISQTDDIKTLEKLQGYITELFGKEDKVLAYTSEGHPLTQSAYKKDVDEAIAQVDSGSTISQEDMEKGL